MLNLFQHLMFVKPDNKEIPKPVRNDKLYVIASDTKDGARQSRGGFCGLLRHFIPRNDDRVFAFTLAEVLITLMIIGIIAALTIPNLMQKYQEQVTVKKVQKFYSNLTNAYALAAKENGPKSEWGLKGNYDGESTEKIYELLFKPYFKIAKNCGRDKKGKCIADQYKRLNNDSFRGNYNSSSSMYKVALDDGAAIFWHTQDNSRANNDNNTATIAYDTNGVKPPNQWGKDTFSFSIINDKIYPSGTPDVYGIGTISDCYPGNPWGYSCAAWVVYKGNMDYLHCKVYWNGKDKCK